MGEVVSMMEAAGFGVVEAYYSIVNDLTFVDAKREGYLCISGCFDLVRLFAKRPSRLNALRLLAYPLVRLRPSLRQLIVVVGVKVGEPKLGAVERWGEGGRVLVVSALGCCCFRVLRVLVFGCLLVCGLVLRVLAFPGLQRLVGCACWFRAAASLAGACGSLTG
jgi:hypothetical protein